MKKQFVISMSGDSAAEAKQMAAWLKTQPVRWSHYIKGLWQIVDDGGRMTAGQLREDIRKIFPNNYVMVFQIPTGLTGWSGWVPEKMADWIEENWE